MIDFISQLTKAAGWSAGPVRTGPVRNRQQRQSAMHARRHLLPCNNGELADQSLGSDCQQERN